MKTIWKFPLMGSIKLDMPKQAKILTVKDLEGIPCIYAEVETDNKDNTETRTIGVYYTGAKLPECDKTYIGTLDMSELIHHFYELKM